MFTEMFCGMGLFFRSTPVSTTPTALRVANPVFCFNDSRLLRHIKFFNIFIVFCFFFKKNFIRREDCFIILFALLLLSI